MNDHSRDTDIEEAWVDDGGRPILDQALEYARYGINVFPVHAKTKRPMPNYGWTELASHQVNHIVEDFTRAVDEWGEDSVSVAWALGVDGYVAVDLDVPIDDHPEWVADIIDDAAIKDRKSVV